MKKVLILIALLITTTATAKEDLEKIAAELVAEAKLIYRSEMASWYGTDMAVARVKDLQTKSGGYFSYPDGEDTKCIFYTRGETPMVFVTVIFDKTFNPSKATVDIGERIFTKTENVYYSISNAAKKQVQEDTFFVSYNNTNFNVVPLYDKKRKQAYVLTGTTKMLVPFGNDYLLTFDDKYSVTEKEQFHTVFLPNDCADTVHGNVHNHLPEKSPFITASDMAIAVLYSSLCHNKSVVVATEKYFSFFNTESWSLLILTKEAMEKIESDQEQRQKTKQ